MAKRKVFDGSVYKDIENKKITTNFPESGGYPETYRMLEECLGWTFFSEPKEVVIDEFCQQLHKTMTEEEIKTWHETVIKTDTAYDMTQAGYTYLDRLTSPYHESRDGFAWTEVDEGATGIPSTQQ